MTAETVDKQIAKVVGLVLDRGGQPICVRVSVASYRTLVARDGLAPRHIGATSCESLRAFVLGFELPVDCDRSVPDDDCAVPFKFMEMGRA